MTFNCDCSIRVSRSLAQKFNLICLIFITVKCIYTLSSIAYWLSLLLNTLLMHDSCSWCQYSPVSTRSAREGPGEAKPPWPPLDPPMLLHMEFYSQLLS